MRALLRKFSAHFFHFMVSSIDPLKRLFGLFGLNFAPNLHCCILNHQYAYVECELKKISQLYRPVLMMTINYRFVAVRSNWASFFILFFILYLLSFKFLYFYILYFYIIIFLNIYILIFLSFYIFILLYFYIFIFLYFDIFQF